MLVCSVWLTALGQMLLLCNLWVTELGVISFYIQDLKGEWQNEPFKPNILTPETAAFHYLVFPDFPKVLSVFMKSHRRVSLSANGMIEHQTWQMCQTLKHYWHTVRGWKNRFVNILTAAQGETLNVWIYAHAMDLANCCTVCYGLHLLYLL